MKPHYPTDRISGANHFDVITQAHMKLTSHNNINSLSKKDILPVVVVSPPGQ